MDFRRQTVSNPSVSVTPWCQEHFVWRLEDRLRRLGASPVRNRLIYSGLSLGSDTLKFESLFILILIYGVLKAITL